VDLVIQRVEPSSGIGLGRPVKRMLQSTDRAGTPDARGGTSHNGTHRPLLDQPAHERSSGPSHHRRLCCPSGSIGTTTASDAVPADRPLPGSPPVIRRHAPVRFRSHRAEDGLPSSRHHLLNVPRPLRRGVPQRLRFQVFSAFHGLRPEGRGSALPDPAGGGHIHGAAGFA
jgi:hypothetical protein